jgi:hypothetical protein
MNQRDQMYQIPATRREMWMARLEVAPKTDTWIKSYRSVAQTTLGRDSPVPGGAAGGCRTHSGVNLSGHLLGESCPLSKVSVKSGPPQPAPDSARLYPQYPLPVMQQEGPVRIPLAHPSNKICWRQPSVMGNYRSGASSEHRVCQAT